MLPLSHDEVVHGKGSLLSRMPGDEWQRFANLRILYSFMFTHPGTKLLFMGAEMGQYDEWNHDQELRWHLLDHEPHKGIYRLIRELNRLYRAEPALFEFSFQPQGFEWVDYSDRENSVVVFRRLCSDSSGQLLVVINFTPVVRHDYHIGVPLSGGWQEIFSSDDQQFGGSGVLNDVLETVDRGFHGQQQSLSITLPPLAVAVFKPKS